ncbi:GNAT family N-acetyltransferase [Sphingomonas sp. NCPPB 2930]
MNILRARPTHAADLHTLLDEYFEALAVVKRDTPAAIARSLADPADATWLAYVDGVPAGCVALRPLALEGALAGSALECKRLYARPAYRGRGISAALLDAMEAHAHQAGATWIYLDSKDDLKSALRIYAQRGYAACARYNDNPQATVFMRKRVG